MAQSPWKKHRHDDEEEEEEDGEDGDGFMFEDLDEVVPAPKKAEKVKSPT